ncbi:MAG: sulfatase, partial [Planctomycetota bacterium]
MHGHNPIDDRLAHLTRRRFIGRGAHGIGTMALGAMILESLGLGGLAREAGAAGPAPSPVLRPRGGGLVGLPHFAPKAKRVLCLFQSEGFSHIDLFDPKQALWDHAGKDLPASVKGTQRVTGMTSGQGSFPVVP